MLLLFTLLSKSKNLLLKYDTKLKQGKFFKISGHYLNNNFLQTSGIIFSGDCLCVGIQNNNNKNDSILIYNIYSNDFKIFECNCIKNIGNIISVYPGKLYVDSQDTNSISCIDFDSVNFSFFSDDFHYIFNDKNNYKIKSLCSYKSNWFIVLQKYKRIYDLTNNRIVFSDVDNANNLFFNSNHRLCFIETGRNLFHFGDDIIKVKNNPTCAIEDRELGGYWIVCNTTLYFYNYDGLLKEKLDLSSYGLKFNNVIEAQGNFIKL